MIIGINLAIIMKNLFKLGVEFNTPGIIRFPFEKLAYTHDNITLIRINDKYNDIYVSRMIVQMLSQIF